MTFDFGTLIAHLAKTRNIGAGSIIGSGTVSNRDSDGGPGKPIDAGGLGYRCIAEVRTVETILEGKAEDRVPQARRHGPHLDGRRGRPPDLRRDRADGRLIGLSLRSGEGHHTKR